MSISPQLATFALMKADLCPAAIPHSELSVGQITLLRENFVVVEELSGIAALVFYRHLFTLDPSLRPLFHSGIELQGRKLMEALEFTLAALDNPTELVPVLEALGRRHVTYGTRDEHYATMTEAMLLTLRETLGNKFSAEAEQAWRVALGFIHKTMIHGASVVRELLQNAALEPSGPAQTAGH